MTEMEELEALYAEAHEAGLWIKEWQGMAGAGDLRDLEYFAESAGVPALEVYEALSLGDVVDLGVPSGGGVSRVEIVRGAVEAGKRVLAADEERPPEHKQWPRTAGAREKLGLPVGATHELGTF